MKTITIELNELTKKTVELELPYYGKIKAGVLNTYFKILSKNEVICINDWPSINETEIKHSIFIPDISKSEMSSSEEFQMALVELKRHIEDSPAE